MAIQPFYNEEAVTVGGETLRLVINFRTIDAVESLLERDFDTLLNDLADPRKRTPRGTQAKLVWGLLREHHPETTLDQAMTLANGAVGEAMGLAIAKLVSAAFAFDDPKKEKGENPPKPRGASKPS
jgi:hypothetical protein